MLLTTLLLCVAPWEGKLIVDPNPPDAEVFVDDEPCTSPCEVATPTPGRHVILVRRQGFEHRTVELTTALNERKFVHVELFAKQQDPVKQARFARDVRVSGWALLGVSLATMATAGILQMTVTQRLSERAAGYPAPPEAPLVERAARNDALLAAQRAQTATISVAVAGGLILAGAVALLALGPDPHAPAAKTSVSAVSLTPILGPSTGGAQAGVLLGF